MILPTGIATDKSPIEFGHIWMDHLMKEPLKNAKKYGKRQFRLLAQKIKKAAYKNLDVEIYPELQHYAEMPPP